MKITGSAGSGDKIINNMKLFKYKFNEEVSENDFYSFEVWFDKQDGFLNYRKEDQVISNVNLDLTGFPKTLGSHNDSSLLKLAKKLDSSL